MPEPAHTPNGQPQHPGVRYEPTDASLPAILKILIGAIVFLIVTGGILLKFFFVYLDHEAAVKKSPFALAPLPANGLPSSPRLEQLDRITGDESANVNERETRNLAVLNSYGSTNESGYVHIPIQRAMELLVQRKTLRSRGPVPEDQSRRANGLLDSGASSSGRVFREGNR